jgi:hypothetical protein
LQWHLEAKLTVITAALLLLSAGLLMWTPLPIFAHLAGAAILIAVVILQNRRRGFSSA